MYVTGGASTGALGSVAGSTRGADIPWKGKLMRVRLVEVAPNRFLFEKVAPFFLAMQDAAKRAGIPWKINTAYRSTAEQGRLYAGYLAAQKAGMNPKPVAKPGTSDHERGLSVDIDTQGQGHDSPTYKWLNLWAGGQGFVNDVASEAWHWTHKYQFSPSDVVDDPVPEDDEGGPGGDVLSEMGSGIPWKLVLLGGLGYAWYRVRRRR